MSNPISDLLCSLVGLLCPEPESVEVAPETTPAPSATNELADAGSPDVSIPYSGSEDEYTCVDPADRYKQMTTPGGLQPSVFGPRRAP